MNKQQKHGVWLQIVDVSFQRVQRRMISVDNFFVFLRLLFLAMLLLYVTDVETIFHLSYVLTASRTYGNLF